MLKRAMVMAVEMPNTGMVTPSAAEPADQPVQAYLTGLNQRRLEDEKDDPANEHGRVNIKKKGADRISVDELSAYRMTESVADNGGNQQRHGQVKIPVQRM
ncbi:hypothetical protein [Silvibacterium sp.]|uniref:hypothetical protein n=1 Tax=Silvibacterium sp. TaxID=1964179 RepID=UPI0039E42FED